MALRIRLKDLAAARLPIGYLCLHVLLVRECLKTNRKQVSRLYRLEGLEPRHKLKKRRLSALRIARPAAKASNNEFWSMDFVSDCLHEGRRPRGFRMVDNVSRVSPAIEGEIGLSGSLAEVTCFLPFGKALSDLSAEL